MEKENDAAYTWLLYLPVVLGIANLWRSILMNDSIIVALIGAAAVIIAALIAAIASLISINKQLKRDSQTLSEISKDTSVEIKPKVSSIDASVKALVPSIVKIEDRSTKIDTIASAVDHFRFLKDQSGIQQEELIAQIAKLFDTNSQLVAQQKIDQQTISKLTLENLQLTGEVDKLRQQLRNQEEEYEPEM